MGRQFGAIRKLPSGDFQARYIAAGIGRVTAPITFGRYDQADTWLAAQRVDLARDLEGAVGVQHLPAAVRGSVAITAHEAQAAHG